MRSPVRRLIVAAAAFAVVVATACVDAVPSGPLQAPSLATGSGGGGDTLRARLEREADAARERLRAEKDRSRAAYDSLRRLWDLQRGVSDPSGVEILACEPLEFAYDVEIVGREGATLQMGPHRLEIPSGALDAPVVIEAVAPLSPVREVRFAPHGLRFKRSPQLTMSFKDCYLPANFRGQVAYVDDAYTVLELPRTAAAEWTTETLRAWIDHFSGYLVAHTRTTR